ncbi:uncharacterized protein LOC142978995 [Anticarsia gemmatalis]|uniref:uncharacterized protein LOC142978995 n=1 Tax=Anticarsia gemmatalis TaxID=129554 RepID=UPI003F75A745
MVVLTLILTALFVNINGLVTKSEIGNLVNQDPNQDSLKILKISWFPVLILTVRDGDQNQKQPKYTAQERSILKKDAQITGQRFPSKLQTLSSSDAMKQRRIKRCQFMKRVCLMNECPQISLQCLGKCKRKYPACADLPLFDEMFLKGPLRAPNLFADKRDDRESGYGSQQYKHFRE